MLPKGSQKRESHVSPAALLFVAQVFLQQKNATSFSLFSCKLTEVMAALDAVLSWPRYRSNTHCCGHSLYLKTPWAMGTTHTHTDSDVTL